MHPQEGCDAVAAPRWQDVDATIGMLPSSSMKRDMHERHLDASMGYIVHLGCTQDAQLPVVILSYLVILRILSFLI
jgi:hypothetical protein